MFDLSDVRALLLTRDTEHDVLIVIPTIAKPSVLVPSFERLCRHLDGLRVHVVASLNPVRPEDAIETAGALRQLWQTYVGRNPGCHLSIYDHGRPAGFGGAINLGLRVALGIVSPAWSTCPEDARGIPPLTIFWNDDLHVTEGWLRGQLDALTSEYVEEWSEFADPDTLRRTKRPAKDYGRIGLIGPASNLAAGIQQIGPDHAEKFRELGVDGFAAWWSKMRSGSVLTATFLSGFCLGITYECMNDLAEYNEDGCFEWLFDERYLVAGYEDNDLCVRADLAGWRAAVAAEVFVGHIGHQTFDAEFPGMDRGMRNRLVYYEKWAPWIASQGTRLVAVYRVRFDVPHDLHLFRVSLMAMSTLVDGVAILLTRNPAEMRTTEEYARESAANRIPRQDLELLATCTRAPSEAAAALARWAADWLGSRKGHREIDVRCESWDGEFNERDERNHLLGIAEGMRADWILSVDHDEYLEPRATRELLERHMRHPDPLVQQWDLAFINHWENNRMYRVDRPWGDDGQYTSGMRGYRLYRVNKAAPRRILAGGANGLHCGNIPAVDAIAKRVAGLRMRHFGYMQAEDRFRKEKRYNVQDPNPDPLLVGGSDYSHITYEERLTLSAFVPENGIGLHMLVYEGERADDVGRLLDQVYGIVDRVVLVWTGAWAPEDTGWLLPPARTSALHARASVEGLPVDVTLTWEGPRLGSPTVRDAGAEGWHATGPGAELARMAERFGVEWVHRPLNDDIAGARNAGINALHGTPGLGWALFFDPDEHLPPMAPIMLRRMAECGDAWGWMFRFRNAYADGNYNLSESIRMSRLDPGGRMRMNGRVHESFSRTVAALVAEGKGNVYRVAPFTMLNEGLSREPEAMDAKLEKYRRLTEMDLREDPMNAGGWTTLALFWLNEGCELTAMECFSRAMQCAGTAYLPYQEAALQHLRIARLYMGEAVQRMQGHTMQKPNAAIVDFLDRAAPPLPRLGLIAHGERPPVATEAEAMASLPPFPAG